MKIYDISQEVFGCAVFPGDPHPEREIKLRISEGAMCNLSAFSMCAHNGTHVDAPLHFIDGTESVDRVDLDKFIGYAYVAEHDGPVRAEDAARILEKAAAGRLSARSLTRHRDALLRAAVAADRAEALPTLMPKRRMEPERFLELVSFAEKNGSPAAMAWLLQYRRAHYSPAEFDALAERRLDLELGLAELTEAELRRLFRLRYLKGGVCVCGVRAERRSYEIPASIGGKPVIGVDAAAFYAPDPMPRVRRAFSGGTDSRRLQTLQAGERIRLGRSMAKRAALLARAVPGEGQDPCPL